MRIAQVTATFPPYQGGTGNVCAYAARELARRGHEVQVLTAAAPDGRGGEGPGAPQAPVGTCLQVRRLRPLLRVGNAPLLPGLIGALRGFDLVHLHYPFIFGTEAVVLASALYGTPLVVSFHNDLIGDGLRAPLFSMYQRLAACLTLRGAARLCAVSLDHYASSQLSRSLSDRPDLAVELPNGVDAEHFCVPGPRADLCRRYGVAPGARVLLFVAALDRAHHFKGLGTLLQALGSLPPDVWLLIVGDGDQRAEHELTVRRLGLAARTVFAGRLEQQSLPPVYRSVDLTVLPSSPPESFGLVLIESLACGTPAVASRIPGVRTVIDHGADGLLVPPGDPAALAGAIRHLLGDERLRRAMGRHGRAKVEQRYSWAQIGARLESIYQQVRLEARPRARALEYGGTMTEFARLAGPVPLEYRYALDAAMPVLASAGPPLVLCNVPELEHEVRQRVARRAGAARVDAALWVEPLLQSWRVDLAFLSDVLSEGGPLVVVASRPLARTLPERRPWRGRPLGFAPGGVGRLRRALTPAGLTLEGTYGLHAAPAVWLSLLSRLAERWGRPDLGDRLHFAARLRYCTSGRLEAWSTVALLTARKVPI